MVPYVRDSGPIHGYRPATEKRIEARTSGFQAPHEQDPRWRDRAACRNIADPEAFFAVGASLDAISQNEAAKAFCASWCPVRTACLRFAFDAGVSDGVWGGAEEAERRRAQRRLSRAGVAATTTNLVRATELLLAEQVSS
jgi:WhiB family redox-sensing transcriptional regulator